MCRQLTQSAMTVLPDVQQLQCIKQDPFLHVVINLLICPKTWRTIYLGCNIWKIINFALKKHFRSIEKSPHSPRCMSPPTYNLRGLLCDMWPRLGSCHLISRDSRPSLRAVKGCPLLSHEAIWVNLQISVTSRMAEIYRQCQIRAKITPKMSYLLYCHISDKVREFKNEVLFLIKFGVLSVYWIQVSGIICCRTNWFFIPPPDGSGIVEYNKGANISRIMLIELISTKKGVQMTVYFKWHRLG